MTTNVALYECFNRIRYAPEMEPFREWLKSEREAARDRLENLQGEAFRVEQGKAQMLREIQGRIEGALKALEKAR